MLVVLVLFHTRDWPRRHRCAPRRRFNDYSHWLWKWKYHLIFAKKHGNLPQFKAIIFAGRQKAGSWIVTIPRQKNISIIWDPKIKQGNKILTTGIIHTILSKFWWLNFHYPIFSGHVIICLANCLTTGNSDFPDGYSFRPEPYFPYRLWDCSIVMISRTRIHECCSWTR